MSELTEMPAALLLRSTWMHKDAIAMACAITAIVKIDENSRAATKWYTEMAKAPKPRYAAITGVGSMASHTHFEGMDTSIFVIAEAIIAR